MLSVMFWTALTILFFFSLFMVLVSFFTPRTAIFFKEKSRRRGAIIWLSTALVSAVLVNEVGPTFSPEQIKNATEAAEAAKTGPPGLPGYSYQVREDIQGKKLVVTCTLNAATEPKNLRPLALKVYGALNGQAYQDVYIDWRLPGQGADAAPWAQTNCLNGNWDFKHNAPVTP
jgi:hypothetical protein